MADWRLLFPSKYLSPADLGGRDQTMKIATIRLGTIDGTDEVDGKTIEVKKQKGILTFEGIPKEYIITKMVGYAMSMLFGDDASKWKGHAITFYAPVETWFGEDAPRLRVKGSPELKQSMKKQVKIGRKKKWIELVPTGDPVSAPISEPYPEEVKT
jgi:hypothetical protein